MADPIFSPDGKFMWTGSDWIPSPPTSSQSANVNLQDSVVGGDVNINNTEIIHEVECPNCNSIGSIITACSSCKELFKCHICDENQFKDTVFQISEKLQSLACSNLVKYLISDSFYNHCQECITSDLNKITRMIESHPKCDHCGLNYTQDANYIESLEWDEIPADGPPFQSYYKPQLVPEWTPIKDKSSYGLTESDLRYVHLCTSLGLGLAIESLNARIFSKKYGLEGAVLKISHEDIGSHVFFLKLVNEYNPNNSYGGVPIKLRCDLSPPTEWSRTFFLSGNHDDAVSRLLGMIKRINPDASININAVSFEIVVGTKQVQKYKFNVNT